MSPLQSRPWSSPRLGMTLVEMLVATVMTLVIMGVVAQLFGLMGQGLTGSRKVLELDAQLRGVAHTLRTDLAGITVDTLPPVAPERDSGYLEIIEGPVTDLSAANAGNPTTLTADWDDVLMFTTRSFGDPFVGRGDPGVFGVSTIRSQLAEVIWFCRESPPSQQILLGTGTTLYTLHRRQLLVMPFVGLGSFLTGGNSVTGALPAFQNLNDLSVHATAVGGPLIPNSLADLTKRENRFLHNPTGIVSGTTFPFDVGGAFSTLGFDGHLTGLRAGEDVVIANVIAFDVRVFDPQAPLAGGATGDYVDLGNPGAVPVAAIGTVFPPTTGSIFGTRGVRVSNAPQNRTLTRPTYDTWSSHYEANGLDEDGDSDFDEGTNAIDDNGDGIVDDVGEHETSPPYPVPLRALEIRIRCYEPESRQVRQVTIRHTFVPH
jgi:hypothetical protein